MKLTALIPAYNDDYTLRFCLASIVDHFAEIVVLDDASTDDTPDVAADFARRHRHVRYVRHQGRQLGWVKARTRLLELTDAEHLFWLDADDVLAEYNAPLLQKIAERGDLRRFKLVELWGDWDHGTGRKTHADCCHLYVNRRKIPGFMWRGDAGAKCSPQSSSTHPGVLFFHVKGVKPDWRLVERQFIRGFLSKRDANPDGLAERVRREEMDDAEIHRRAMKMLLTSKIDRITRRYGPGVAPENAGLPRPAVITVDSQPRFEMVLDAAGKPVDRIDNGPQTEVGSRQSADL